jgi:dienelactone hydrolase
MSLAAGRHLGHYRITAAIGAGGMGEVYRATDTKLGREVAIKVLPPELAADPERRARFEQEAAVVAALNHPNIVTLHSVEEDAGVHFITMELVEGRVLSDSIPPDGFPLQDFLGVAIPIADAIGSAHAKGIVHRDLKPANVMLDADGRVKVLDFGLAKAAVTATDEDETAVAAGHTRAGQLLGTVAYMSPEQAEGRPVDPRSDVFALGIVLYQMATGRHPFQRGSTVSTLSAILKDTPEPVAAVKHSLPPVLGEILGRCLEKAPERRYPSAIELRDRLRDLHTTVTSGALAARPATLLAALRRPRVSVPAAILLVGAVALSAWLYRRWTRAQWARQVALPEIERLLDASAGGAAAWQAYLLGREAERFIPDDPLLERLRGRYSNPLTIRSDPPGARVYAKPYALVEGEWEILGQTPIEARPFVAGVLRVRIEKEGYERFEDLYWNRLFQSDDRGYVLRLEGSLPEGMVWVPRAGPELVVEAAPAGLHMPGVEHLPPRTPGDFFVDRFEVTNREYERFVEAGGYERPDYWKEPFVENGRTLTFAEAMARFRDRTQRPGPSTWEVGDPPEGQGDHAVTGVSWYEAAAYAEFAGKRLPSIYHWDRVALTWASGDIVPLSNLGGSRLERAGARAGMNRYGTYDLAGNAREWCANASSRGGRFILGGGWNDPAYAFNDAYAQSPWDRSETNGFRCIRPADGSAADANLEAEVPLPFRDFRSEPGVSDETFALFLSQYRYDDKSLHAQVEETREEEDYTRQKVAFDAAYGGERMTAYLFLPKKGSPPFQTVVLFPGSGAIHTRSSASLNPGMSLFVLKGGRALLQPVYKSTYERGDGLASDYPDETSGWRDHVVMWGKDVRRSIDYLQTRPDVDGERLAYMGISWGAAMGPIMMAVEPRLKTGVVVVAGLNFQRALPEVDEVHYAPRVKIPVLMLNGKYDFFFPYETSQVPFFELLGTPPALKKLVVHETSHSFPRTDLARESLAWLDEHLGPAGARP